MFCEVSLFACTSYFSSSLLFLCRSFDNSVIKPKTVADLGFPRGGALTPKVHEKSYYLVNFSSGSRGGREGHAPPPSSSVKISHKKDGRQRRLHRFHVSRLPFPPPPGPGFATGPFGFAKIVFLQLTHHQYLFQSLPAISCGRHWILSQVIRIISVSHRALSTNYEIFSGACRISHCGGASPLRITLTLHF